jgi:hypothetical protein
VPSAVASRSVEARYFIERSESSCAFFRIWTTAKFAKFLVLFYLILNDSIAVLFETLERGHLGGKNLVHRPPFLIPMVFKGSGREIGFRLKRVVETSFVDPGATANVINADRSVTTFPDQSDRGIQELLFGITLSLHDANLVDWLV